MAICKKKSNVIDFEVSGIPEPSMDGKEIYSSLARLCFSGNGRLSLEETRLLYWKLNGAEWGSDVGMERYEPFMFPDHSIYVSSNSVTYELKGISIFNPYSRDSYLVLIGNDYGRNYLSLSPVASDLMPVLEDFYKSSRNFVVLCNLNRNFDFWYYDVKREYCGAPARR